MQPASDRELYLAGVRHLHAQPPRLVEAIGAFERALEVYPSDANALSKLGRCFHQQGRCDLAIEEYAQGLAIDPMAETSWLGPGHAYFARGDLERARLCYSRVRRESRPPLPPEVDPAPVVEEPPPIRDIPPYLLEPDVVPIGSVVVRDG